MEDGMMILTRKLRNTNKQIKLHESIHCNSVSKISIMNNDRN